MTGISDTTVSKKQMLEFLEAEFEPEEHLYEQQGNLYVGINPTINRLNEFQKTFNIDWHFAINSSTVEDSGTPTNSGKKQYRAVVTCTLTIGDYNLGLGSRDGTGAATNFDPDTAIKSAQAYALRKAGNLFGIATYLKDEESRNEMEQQMRDQGEITALKDQLAEVAELNGVEFTDNVGENANLMAAFLNVSVKDLQDVNVLRRLVEANCERS